MELRRRIAPALIAATAPFGVATAQDTQWEVGGALGLEARLFVEEPQFPGQLEGVQPSLTIEPDIRWTSEDGQHQLVLLPFVRIDGADDERTHGDLREAYYRYVGDDFDLTIGAAKVFWGVAESRHLVDVINQTDGLEDIDEEDKLGQPMVKLSLLKDWGQLDFFYLPYVRERAFPGEDGRLRFPALVDDQATSYERGAGQWSPSIAAQYSHYFGEWDVSINAISGVSREPRFSVTAAGELAPIYDDINQLGATAQYTKDALLLKGEAIVREGQGETFTAFVGGVEYTLYGVSGSSADIGLLVEYLYDGRDDLLAPPTAFENDVFIGGRLGLNDIQDTAILAGTITDLDDGSLSGLIEAERRIGQNWTASVEGRFFTNIDSGNLLSSFENDSHITLSIKRYY